MHTSRILCTSYRVANFVGQVGGQLTKFGSTMVSTDVAKNVMYILNHIFMSDTPPPEQAPEPTLTSLLASICAANRPGRVLRLTDPVRTHGFNALQRAYIYALLDRSGIMRIIGSTRCKLSVRLSCYRSSLKTQHTSSPLFRYMEETGQDFSGWTIIPLKTLYYECPEHYEHYARSDVA